MAGSTQADLQEQLRRQFVGKNLQEISVPAAILDVSKVKRNCVRMLEAVDALEFGWRAHIKTHKTTELTRLQVGDGATRPANIVTSTVVEAENVLPLLLEYKELGRPVNVLWGFPVLLSAAPRLARIATALGSGGLSLMVDHPEQLKGVHKVCELSGVAPDIYIKIDMGTKRSGVVPGSQVFSQLVSDLLTAEESGSAVFVGLYSHAGHSYSGGDRATALDLLRQELEALLAAAHVIQSRAKNKELILTVGATPTTTSVRNLLLPDAVMTADEQIAIAAVRATVDAIKRSGCSVEIHAGVYPVLDLQQLSTHALSSDGANPMLSWKDMALTILTEVASLYPSRSPNGTPEALIAAGNLALGREPCKAYNGWGIVSPWNISRARVPDVVPEKHAEWQIRKISQEHGILSWAGAPDDAIPLTIGQRLRIWPNHACIAAAGFDWYLIVDSELAGREDEIIDVWPRWRGW